MASKAKMPKLDPEKAKIMAMAEEEEITKTKAYLAKLMGTTKEEVEEVLEEENLEEEGIVGEGDDDIEEVAPEDEEYTPDEDAEIPKPKGKRKQPPRKAGAPERFEASRAGADPRLVAAGKKAQKVLAEKYGEEAKEEGIAEEGKNPGAQLTGRRGARGRKAAVTGEPERGD